MQNINNIASNTAEKMAHYATDDHGFEDIRLFFYNTLKNLLIKYSDCNYNEQRAIINNINSKIHDRWMKEYKEDRDAIQELIIKKQVKKQSQDTSK